MKSFCAALVRDLREVTYPVLFLFCMFNVVGLTNALILESYSITPTHTFFAAIGAVIGGKAILVANKLPYLHLFKGRPVIVAVLWRSFVYAVFCALFMCSEHIITGFFEHQGPVRSLESITKGISVDHVLANGIWLFVSLMLYNSYVEVDRQLGKGSLRRILFSK